jgi:hypothetical protein
MNQHQYILETGSKKHYCPECNKKRFVRYIDKATGFYLPEQYGRCDRESNCSYHLNPYLDGYTKALREKEKGNYSEFQYLNNSKPKTKETNLPTSSQPTYFDYETFKQTLNPERYAKNTFIQNLLSRVKHPFTTDEVKEVVQLYYLGTVVNGYRAGAITFPFIDIMGNVRAVQVKQFDENNHTTGTDFLHSIISKYYKERNEPLPNWLKSYESNGLKVSCLFGEHLLRKYPLNPVALVEAPKTAIYGTLYFGLPETPENLIWLAVYNKSSFSFDKLKVLQGRYMIVFPDTSKDGSTFNEWRKKATDYETRLPGTHFIFSDLLEQLANPEQKENGADIADILITHNWNEYRKEKIQSTNTEHNQKLSAVNKTSSKDNSKRIVTYGELFVFCKNNTPRLYAQLLSKASNNKTPTNTRARTGCILHN